MVKKTVMIIDDDVETLMLMKKQLEVLYDVIDFTSGESALEYLERRQKPTGEGLKGLPDLILLDIIMKDMDGYEVLNRLKGNDGLKRIPVVFLTGMTDETSECKGLEMDVVDYLKKPVTSTLLFARVQHYLDLYSDRTERGRLDEDKLKSLQEQLTDRELEVAKLMAEFRSDREICDILYISMPYAKKLVSSVKEKLSLDKRGDIRRYLV